MLYLWGHKELDNYIKQQFQSATGPPSVRADIHLFVASRYKWSLTPLTWERNEKFSCSWPHCSTHQRCSKNQRTWGRGQVELAFPDSVLGLHLGTAGWYLLKRQILMFWAQSHILSRQWCWNTWNLASDAGLWMLCCAFSSLQPRDCSTLRLLVLHSLLSLLSDSCPLESVMPSNHLILLSSSSLSCFQSSPHTRIF